MFDEPSNPPVPTFVQLLYGMRQCRRLICSTSSRNASKGYTNFIPSARLHGLRFVGPASDILPLSSFVDDVLAPAVQEFNSVLCQHVPPTHGNILPLTLTLNGLSGVLSVMCPFLNQLVTSENLMLELRQLWTDDVRKRTAEQSRLPLDASLIELLHHAHFSEHTPLAIEPLLPAASYACIVELPSLQLYEMATDVLNSPHIGSSTLLHAQCRMYVRWSDRTWIS